MSSWRKMPVLSSMPPKVIAVRIRKMVLSMLARPPLSRSWLDAPRFLQEGTGSRKTARSTAPVTAARVSSGCVAKREWAHDIRLESTRQNRVPEEGADEDGGVGRDLRQIDERQQQDQRSGESTQGESEKLARERRANLGDILWVLRRRRCQSRRRQPARAQMRVGWSTAYF